jgi:pimeloyl-ACP methyl ester carboxylesterase
MCIREPDRFSHFLALAITHPWQSLRNSWRELAHLWYQLVILAPGLGYGLHRSGELVRRALQHGTREGTFTEADLALFADNLAEPARARACVQTYRAFATREQLALARGRYDDTRMPTRTHLLLGDSDPVIKPALLSGYEQHADAMTTEIVPDCGHFIPDEHPDLVTQRAHELFAREAAPIGAT